MLKILLAAVVLIVCGSTSFAEQPPKNYVETITIDNFMRLPFDFQVMYVAGITDGFTYVMRNHDLPEYDEYSACVRQVTLEVATKEMIEQIKQRKEQEPLTTYFAKSLGARCRHN
jgi:hypothetical protein